MTRRPPTEPLTVAEVVRSIAGPIQRVRPSAPYMLGLLVSAVTMVLLPLLYLGIIALVAWGVFLYATHATVMFGGSFGFRVIILKAVAYGAPIVAGGIVVLVMLKPLLARRSREVNPYDIQASQEPAFFAFVKCIADAVGAPVPRRIELTCEPNASASFRRGVLSFLGRDLTLSIGTPLIACMEAEQLAGVIAHELGHFTQAFAMRCTYLVDTVNNWFLRVVDERDSWDDAIDEMIHSESWIGIAFGACSRVAVLMSRLTLHLFMLVGRAVSCATSRQMEFNADLSQIRFAGSEVFALTFDRLDLVGRSFQFTMNESFRDGAPKRLPEDLPALVRSGLLIMPPSLRDYIQRARAAEKARLFDTHPPTRHRIERAARVAAPGVLTMRAPAERLFRNYSVLCRWTTIGFYRDWMGIDVDAAALAPVEHVVEARHEQHDAMEAGDRAMPPIVDPIQLSSLTCNREVSTDQARVLHRTAVEALGRHRTEAIRAGDRAKAAAKQRDGLTIAATLMSMRQKVPAELLDGADMTLDELEQRRTALDKSAARHSGIVDRYTSLLAVRIKSARQLLGESNGGLQAIDDDLERVARIARNRVRLSAIQLGLREAQVILSLLGKAPDRSTLLAHSNSLSTRVRGELIELRDDLRCGVDRPALANLAERVVAPFPPVGTGTASQNFDAANASLSAAIMEYRNAVGRLALAAERVDH